MGVPIPVGATPQLISRQVSQPYLIYNTGKKTIYLGQDSSVNPTSYAFPLAPGNAFQWQTISSDVYAVCDPGSSSLAVIAYEANALSLGSVTASIPDPVDVSGSQVGIVGTVDIEGNVNVAGDINVTNSVLDIQGSVDVPEQYGILFSNNTQAINPALTTIYQTNTGDLTPYKTLTVSWGNPSGSGLLADTGVITFLITWLSSTGSPVEYQRIYVNAVGNSMMTLPIRGPNVLVRASNNGGITYTDALVVAGNSIALPFQSWTNPSSAGYISGGALVGAARDTGSKFVMYRFTANATTPALIMLSSRSGKASLRMKSPAAIDVSLFAMQYLTLAPMLSVNNGTLQTEVVIPPVPLVLSINNTLATAQTADLFISYE